MNGNDISSVAISSLSSVFGTLIFFSVQQLLSNQEVTTFIRSLTALSYIMIIYFYMLNAFVASSPLMQDISSNFEDKHLFLFLLFIIIVFFSVFLVVAIQAISLWFFYVILAALHILDIYLTSFVAKNNIKLLGDQNLSKYILEHLCLTGTFNSFWLTGLTILFHIEQEFQKKMLYIYYFSHFVYLMPLMLVLVVTLYRLNLTKSKNIDTHSRCCNELTFGTLDKGNYE